MSKRLEEIKDMVNSFDDSLFVSLYGYELHSESIVSDFKYLLERVQELEEIKNDAIEQIDVTHRRNKRLEERMLYLEEREKEIININQHEMQYRAELETRNVDLEHQNKRYREAIKRAIGKFNYDEHQEGMSILQKALEGEE